MKHLSLSLLLAVTLGLATPVAGLTQDHRIMTRAYSDGEVVRLEGCLNFQTMITFGTGEKIENVGLGDSNQWQVLPNKRADLLFVKPLTPRAYSNMTVVTDRHAYGFELKMASPVACARGQVLYNLKFTYPKDKAAEPDEVRPIDPESLLPPPDTRNSAYSFQGAKDLVPLRAFDDGQATYFKWAAGVSAPAVYALGTDNVESLVNYANRGNYFVVDLVARAFVLRRGAEVTILYNDRFVAPELDGLSPQPRDPKAGRSKDAAQKPGSHK